MKNLTRPRWLGLLVGCAVTLGVGPRLVAQAAVTQGIADPTQRTHAEADFLMKLHAINVGEIKAGAMARDRAQRPEVKAYGKMLIDDHKDADTKVIDLAKAHSIDLMPQSFDQDVAATRTNLEKISTALSSASDSDFDRVFAEQMVAGHKDAVAMVTAARGQLAPDREFTDLANTLLPHLQHHENQAQQLLDRAVGH